METATPVEDEPDQWAPATRKKGQAGSVVQTPFAPNTPDPDKADDGAGGGGSGGGKKKKAGEEIDGCGLVFFLVVFCGSICAVSSPINRLLLFLFPYYASHLVCPMSLYIPPYLFFVLYHV